MLPVYPNVSKLPDYLSKVGTEASTENFYWSSRLIGALADAHYAAQIQHINRYQETVAAKGRQLILEYDGRIAESGDASLMEAANRELCEMARKETDKTLTCVLQTASERMKNGYNLADN